MRLRALTHLATSAKELCGAIRIIVIGSSSLLGTFPSLGDSGQPIETSLDADLLVEPCDDELAKMLDEALGDGRRFQIRFGYYADILRPAITDLFPRDWESRLIPLAGCDGVFCLEPHDLAVAKLQAGRPKDIDCWRRCSR